MRVPFKQVRYVSTSTSPWTVAYVKLRPDQLGSRLSTIKDTFQLFRVTSLKLKSVYPVTGVNDSAGVAAGITHGCAFTSAYLANLPAFWDDFVQFGRADVGISSLPVTINLRRNELVGEDTLKWWRTDQDEPSGTAEEDFTSQGYMYWASYNDAASTYGSHVNRHMLFIEGVMEFAKPKDTALDFVSGVDKAEVMPANQSHVRIPVCEHKTPSAPSDLDDDFAESHLLSEVMCSDARAGASKGRAGASSVRASQSVKVRTGQSGNCTGDPPRN